MITGLEFKDTETRRAIQRLVDSQLPFVNAKTMTDLALACKSMIIADLPTHFMLRNRWTASGIRIKAATKSNPVAYVGSIDDQMRKQELGETINPKSGFRNVPQEIRSSKSSIIPNDLYPSNLGLGTDSPVLVNGKVPFILIGGRKAKGYGASGYNQVDEESGITLYKKKKGHKDRRRRFKKKYRGMSLSEIKAEMRSGVTGIYIRVGKGKSGLRMIYLLSPSVVVKGTDFVSKPTHKTIKALYIKVYHDNLIYAILTARS